jgi:hypothetical protein
MMHSTVGMRARWKDNAMVYSTGVETVHVMESLTAHSVVVVMEHVTGAMVCWKRLLKAHSRASETAR